MLSFLKKPAEEAKFIPLLTGQLETTYEQLKDDFGNRLAGRIYDLDIANYTKEFSGILKVPAKIQEAVRKVLDDYLKEGEEFYFQVNESFYGVFLGKASKAVAELKIQVIRNEVGRAIEALKQERKVSVKENCGRAVTAKSPVVRSEKRGTLSHDLSEKEMRDWASRALLNMVTSHGFEDFQADINQLSRMIQIQFKPLWHVPNGLVSGYVVETMVSFSEVQYEEKQAQEDLAVLAAAVRHLKVMVRRKEYALLIVPVFSHTICSKSSRDLFNIYCHSIDPELKRFLVFRIKGLDAQIMNQTDWDSLNVAASHCRSVIIEAPKKINPKKLFSLKFHAFGIDISNMRLSEEQLFKLINDFGHYYQRNGKNTYIFGLETRCALLAALNAGHIYVSGSAVAPFLTVPKHASYLELEDLYRESAKTN